MLQLIKSEKICDRFTCKDCKRVFDQKSNVRGRCGACHKKDRLKKINKLSDERESFLDPNWMGTEYGLYY